MARWIVVPMNPDTCLKAIWIHFLVLSLTNALEASRESFRKTFEPFDKWIKADKRKEICSIMILQMADCRIVLKPLHLFGSFQLNSFVFRHLPLAFFA